MGAYAYPDPRDRLTVAMIDELSDPEYWQASEQGVLARAASFVRETLAGLPREAGAPTRGGRLVDAGCGTGRLLPLLASVGDEVLGLEPDASRCARAKALVRERSLGGVRVEGEALDAWLSAHPGARFDGALCSHVIQHVPASVARGVVGSLRSSLVRGGALVLTTTFRDAEDDAFVLERFEGGERRVDQTDLAGFEAAMGRPGTLPVRSFARRSVELMLGEAGFEVVSCLPYHFLGEHDAARDAANRESPAALRTAKDAMYLCVAR